ncbi:MAG: hypothetical protein CSA07_03340, partial [Bacteroidia bacterium]
MRMRNLLLTKPRAGASTGGLLCRALLLLLLLGLGGRSWAEDVHEGPFTYRYDEDKKGYTLLSCDRETTGKVIVPATIRVAGRDVRVRGIAVKAFERCEKLEEVEIADGVTSVIEESTFDLCRKLRRVRLPAELKEIKRRAFASSGLQSVELPEGLRIIGEEAFSNNPIKSIKLPAQLKYLQKKAFEHCMALQSIEIPRGVEGIDGWVFSGCSSLETVTLHEQLKYVGSAAFGACEKLKAIQLPEGLLSIGDSAFGGCKSLTSFTIPPGIRQLPSSLFSYCVNLESIQLPEGLQSIGRNAFNHAKKLRAISIPEGVTFIGDVAFRNCEALESIIIPDGVRRIENSTFKDCHNLQSVVFGASSIGEEAFANCHKLRSIAHSSTASSREPIDVENGAFLSCQSLVELNIDIRRLGAENVFRGCSHLRSYTFGYGHSKVEFMDNNNPNISIFNSENANLETLYFCGESNENIARRVIDASVKFLPNPPNPTFHHRLENLKTIYLHKTNYDGTKHRIISSPAWRVYINQVTIKSYDFEVASTLRLAVGGEAQVNVIKLEPASFRVEWESSDPSVVTVSSGGLASGKQNGVATITARIAGTRISRQVRVTVGNPKAVTGITISPATAELFLGESLQLQAQVLPTNASNRDIVWQREGGISVAVDQQGKVTPTLVGRSRVRVFQPSHLDPVYGLCDINVKARLRFNLDGGMIDNGSGSSASIADQVVEETRSEPIPHGARAKYKSPGIPVKPGYTFMGWYTAEGMKFDGFDQAPDGSYDLIARWEPITLVGPVEHKVSFDLDGGMYDGKPQIDEQTVADQQAATEPDRAKLSKANHSFKHWVDMATGQPHIAVWEPTAGGNPPPPAPGHFRVTFDANEGTGGPTYVDVEEGKPLDAKFPSEKPERAGYEFQGWAKEKTAAAPDFDKDTPVSASLTVFAVWKATGGNPPPPIPAGHFRVTFDANEGTGGPTYVDVEKDKPLGAKFPSEKPERAGHEFQGWAKEKTAAAPDFTKDTPVSASLTVYAVW